MDDVTFHQNPPGTWWWSPGETSYRRTGVGPFDIEALARKHHEMFIRRWPVGRLVPDETSL